MWDGVRIGDDTRCEWAVLCGQTDNHQTHTTHRKQQLAAVELGSGVTVQRNCVLAFGVRVSDGACVPESTHLFDVAPADCGTPVIGDHIALFTYWFLY